MKKFLRQKSPATEADGLKINLRASAAQVARVFEPGLYRLRIDSARLITSSSGNASVVLDITEMDSAAIVDVRPLWIAGPNANAGRLAAENQFLVAQLLELAGAEVDGDIVLAEHLSKLEGLVFEAYLASSTDSRSGRARNALAAIVTDGAL